MVSLTIFLLVVGGVLLSHITGTKLYMISKSKMDAAQQSQDVIGHILYEVWSATNVEIGSGTLGSFTALAAGTTQQGSALRVYSSTNMSQYTYYYFDTNSLTLRRATNSSSYEVYVDSITNRTVFTLEDYQGTVLTNPQTSYVVALNLQFAAATNGNHQSFYDNYQLRTKVKRRRQL